MAQKFVQTGAWVNGTWTPFVSDFQNIVADLATRGVNIDGGGYGRVNTGFITLLGGDLPGVTYTVTGASWSAGTATLTIGAHNITVKQRVAVAGITPTGYNSGSDSVPITAVTSTTISFAVATNPGAWSSGGSVLVNAVAATAGIAARSASGQFVVYSGSAWLNAASSAAGGIGISLGPAASGNSQSSQTITLNGTTSGGSNVTCVLACDLAGTLDITPASGFVSLSGSGTSVRMTIANSSAGGVADVMLTSDNQGFQMVLGGSTSGFNYLGFYDTTNSAFRLIVRRNGIFNVVNVPTYASDSAAGSGGLVTGDMWKDSSGNAHFKL